MWNFQQAPFYNKDIAFIYSLLHSNVQSWDFEATIFLRIGNEPLFDANTNLIGGKFFAAMHEIESVNNLI